ncbi:MULTISPECIES: hypothetical protein [unclassified Polaribacter]|uniref:hypothetical protein n=1 Tax=unclassified Polaribacter TaxID=196858 RepID=UPI00197B8922|nr:MULTISPECIES: hypothetical protein [unclassified Polaribacter]
MNNKNIAILVASCILIILNIVTSNKYNLGFWFRIIAIVFVMLAIVKGSKIKK